MTDFSASGKPIHPTGGYDDARSTGGGASSYWLNGSLHRADGPALTTKEGDQHWYLNGRRHRADGPAIISRNGATHHFVDGVPVSV